MNENKLSDFMDNVNTDDTTLVVSESTEIVSLRVQSDEETLETINNLQDIILSETSNINEKNDAYNDLLAISSNKSIEEKLEKIIKEEFECEAFVKVNSGNITIVVDKSEHDYKLANQIIRRINEEFKENKYITVKFN